jgi:hypothetical protein
MLKTYSNPDVFCLLDHQKKTRLNLYTTVIMNVMRQCEKKINLFFYIYSEIQDLIDLICTSVDIYFFDYDLQILKPTVVWT